MAEIFMPKRPKNSSGNLLALAGAGAGAAFGGPVGAGIGMQAGGMVGGMMDANKSQGPAQVQSSAMSRRMTQLDQSPQRQLRESINSLQYIDDPVQRAELAQPLMQAAQLAKQKGPYG